MPSDELGEVVGQWQIFRERMRTGMKIRCCFGLENYLGIRRYRMFKDAANGVKKGDGSIVGR